MSSRPASSARTSRFTEMSEHQGSPRPGDAGYQDYGVSPPMPSTQYQTPPMEQTNYQQSPVSAVERDAGPIPVKDSGYAYGGKGAPTEHGSDAPEVVSYPYVHDGQQQYGQAGSPPSRTLSPFSADGSQYGGPGSPHAGAPPQYSNLNDKHVYTGDHPQAAYQQHDPNQQAAPPADQKKPKRKLLWLIVALIVALLVLGLALGLGLGLGLKKKNKDSSTSSKDSAYCTQNPQYCIGGYINDKYYSTEGAFNGSGIAIAGESWNNNEYKILTLYFQHWTGSIRYMQYQSDQTWVGGTTSEVVASDAKNGTPISVVSFAVNTTSYYHLFYVDANNTVKQKTNSNTTNIWADGPLNKLNLKALDSPAVGMQACWYGNFYGDSDLSKMPGGDSNATGISTNTAGMHFWYPPDDSSFIQYGWYEGLDSWTKEQTWTGMNGHAGVGCYSWITGSTVSYTMFVDKANTVEFWWKDTNSSLPSTSSHPINSYQNASDFAINDVWPSTSLGYTDFFMSQASDLTFKGYNVSYAAENLTVFADDTLTVSNGAGPVKGLAGTHMSVTGVSFSDKNAGQYLYIFYQTNGSDISIFTRGIQGGQWSESNLPIPAK